MGYNSLTLTHRSLVLYFTIPEEEISAMRLELDKYGIQMPAFSKIGGILANEVRNRLETGTDLLYS